MKYPIYPKSNKFLKPGDYWLVKLSDNSYTIGLVIDIPPSDLRLTREIYIGLLDWNEKHIPDINEIQGIEIIEQGHAHIKTINEIGQGIIGNIDLNNANIKIKETIGSYGANASNFHIMKGYQIIRDFEIEDRQNYPSSGYWGYDYIKTIAEKVFVEKDENWL